MQISELINQLEQKRSKFGNIEVLVLNEDQEFSSIRELKESHKIFLLLIAE